MVFEHPIARGSTFPSEIEIDTGEIHDGERHHHRYDGIGCMGREWICSMSEPLVYRDSDGFHGAE